MNKFHLINLVFVLSLISNEIDGTVIRRRSRNIERNNSINKFKNRDKSSDSKADSKADSFSYKIYYKNSFTNHEETYYSNGTVTGSYFLLNPDFTVRLVSYVADEKGFRVKVKSNENGFKPVNPADAIFKHYNTDYLEQKEDDSEDENDSKDRNFVNSIISEIESRNPPNETRSGSGLSKKNESRGSMNGNDDRDYEVDDYE